jgi:hypothetical protein
VICIRRACFRDGTHLHHERLADRLQIRRDRVHLTVERHDDRRRDTGRRLKLGQTLHRFPESAGARERRELGHDVHDRHDAAVIEWSGSGLLRGPCVLGAPDGMRGAREARLPLCRSRAGSAP